MTGKRKGRKELCIFENKENSTHLKTNFYKIDLRHLKPTQSEKISRVQERQYITYCTISLNLNMYLFFPTSPTSSSNTLLKLAELN